LLDLPQANWKNPTSDFDKKLVVYLQQLGRQFDGYWRTYESSTDDAVELSPWFSKHFSHIGFKKWQKENSYYGEKWSDRHANALAAVRAAVPTK
jgi:hypothetical protein